MVFSIISKGLCSGRRIEAKIAAENFGAAIGFAAGAAMAVKEKLDEHAAREEQKKQQHEQTMGGL